MSVPGRSLPSLVAMAFVLVAFLIGVTHAPSAWAAAAATPRSGVPIGPAEPVPLPAPSAPPEDAVDLSPATVGAIVLVLLILGLILLFIEVELIPGLGVAGISGVVVILASLGLAFWQLELWMAIFYSVFSFVALILLALWTVYVFPHTSMGRRLRLDTRISVEEGYTAIRDLSYFIGQEGVATSDLRPSGIARIGTERLDVVSDGEFVPRGTPVKVVGVKSGSAVVVPRDPPTA